MNENNSRGLALKGERLVISRHGARGFVDSRFLIAILLAYVAGGDGDVAESEIEVMLELVADTFGLDHAQALSHLSRAMAVFAQDMNLETTGQFLQESLNEQEVEDVVLMLLKVAAADGERNADEISAVDDVAEALAVTPKMKHQAYQRFFSDEQQSPRRAR